MLPSWEELILNGKTAVHKSCLLHTAVCMTIYVFFDWLLHANEYSVGMLFIVYRHSVSPDVQTYVFIDTVIRVESYFHL